MNSSAAADPHLLPERLRNPPPRSYVGAAKQVLDRFQSEVEDYALPNLAEDSGRKVGKLIAEALAREAPAVARLAEQAAVKALATADGLMEELTDFVEREASVSPSLRSVNPLAKPRAKGSIMGGLEDVARPKASNDWTEAFR